MTNSAPTFHAPLVNCGIAARAFFGAKESGDLHLVQPYDGGVLVAVADGLGHGPEAARAAQTAIGTVAAQPHMPVLRLIEECHRALQNTRGAVLTLASIDAAAKQMTWVGVGNVEALLLRMNAMGARGREAIIQHGGIVGHRCPTLRAATLPIHPGDILVLATDGIHAGFEKEIGPDKSPQEIADRILKRYGKASDDALVFVGRWNGRTVPDEA